MPSPVLDLFIARYLSTPSAAFSSTSFRGLISKASPIVSKATTNSLLRGLPSSPLGASFVVAERSMGNFATERATNDAILWAKLTTTLLGKITLEDQDAALQRYGNIKSQVIPYSNIYPGLFYTFKYKAEADVYDKWPLTLVLSRDKDSMLGLNFHYLPYKFRFALFEALMPLITPIPVTQLSIINIAYQQLLGKAKFQGYRPTIKRYNFKRIESQVVFIAPIEWAIAMAYPNHSFVGKNVTNIWQESIANV